MKPFNEVSNRLSFFLLYSKPGIEISMSSFPNRVRNAFSMPFRELMVLDSCLQNHSNVKPVKVLANSQVMIRLFLAIYFTLDMMYRSTSLEIICSIEIEFQGLVFI